MDNLVRLATTVFAAAIRERRCPVLQQRCMQLLYCLAWMGKGGGISLVLELCVSWLSQHHGHCKAMIAVEVAARGKGKCLHSCCVQHMLCMPAFFRIRSAALQGSLL